jgi:antitoxin (DNA-binding transcriptional repressor) of toxin-antitoxin stability system
MTRVGVETMKDQLGDYLQRAWKGEKILITEHRRSVALLTSREEDVPVQRALELVKAGVAEWSGGKPAGIEATAASPWPERFGDRWLVVAGCEEIPRGCRGHGGDDERLDRG